MLNSVAIMKWILIALLTTTFHLAFAEDEIDNEVSVPPPPINLDSNLRKALLKALTELENEENQKEQYNTKDKFVEKASASSVSIFANSESVSAASPATTTTESTEKPVVLFQRSESYQQPSIVTLEKDDTEQIQTSATSSFASLKSDQPKLTQSPGLNLISTEDKQTTRAVEFTTPAVTVSTEESQAKVEDVQFFSAPLVAAFTVHQDELGLPKKVEPIYKQFVSTQDITIPTEQTRLQITPSDKEIKQEQQYKKKQEEFRQLDLHQKQKALEQEIIRLNQNLRQQQDYLLQQEQLRLKANSQPFIPIPDPNFSTPRPVFNQAQQLPVKEPQLFKSEVPKSSISLLPSITFDPLLEAGKLPFNGQILPVKGPGNFHAPLIQTTGFQQFQSLTPPPVNNAFNQQNQFVQGNRFFQQDNTIRQFPNDFRSTSSFSIQKSLQPTPVQTETFFKNNLTPILSNFDNQVQQSNRFFRNNLESSLTSLQSVPFQQQPQHTRLFRSNLEGNFGTNNFYRPQENSQHLSNLLYNSGALRGKSPEDFNLITKVLSLNHVRDNRFAGSSRHEQRIPYLKRA